MAKRLGAFLFFDKDGIVGDYVEYLLEKMSNHLDRLIVICNGDVLEAECQKFNKFTSEIIRRENKGFDAGGWKELFLEYLEDEDLAKYDEIVMFNNSFFGPMYPLNELFEEMDNNSKLDFWGITKHGKTKNIWGLGDYEYFPEHIQSYFLCIRKNMFLAKEFHNYWGNMKYAETIEEAVTFFEVTFTHEFEKQGFKWDVYVDTNEHISDDLKNINTYMYYLDDILINKRCPFVKRKALYSGMSVRLARCDTSFTNKCMKYIETQTDYPADYIRKQLIRMANVREIYEAFHLDYILSEDYCITEPEKKKVALVMHIYYPELFEYCRDYAMSMPEYADIYITTSRTDYMDEIKSLFGEIRCNKLEIIVVDGRGRDLSGLLVGAKEHLMEYEYLCFIHDKMSLRDFLPGAGESFCNTLFESMLCSKEYVNNVLSLMENNKMLGVLSPPLSYVGPYVDSYCGSWAMKINISKVEELSEMLDINCNISKDFPPITIGSAFWCRTSALKKIFEYDWQYESFPEQIGSDGSLSHGIERVFGYVAQDAGFFTGVVYPTRLAQLVLSNVSCMFRMIYYKAKRCCQLKRVRNLNHVLKSLDKTREKIINLEKKVKRLSGRKAALKHAVKSFIKI